MNLDIIHSNVEVRPGAGGAGDADRRSVSAIQTPTEQSIDAAEADGLRVRVLYRDEELLERYLSGRALSLSARRSYRSAVRSFSGLVGVPLEEAGRP